MGAVVELAADAGRSAVVRYLRLAAIGLGLVALGAYGMWEVTQWRVGAATAQAQLYQVGAITALEEARRGCPRGYWSRK